METHRLKSVLLKTMTNQTNNLNDLAILNGESEGPNDGFVAPLDVSDFPWDSSDFCGA